MNHQDACYQQMLTDVGYSVRRYYVDDFFFRQIERFSQGANMLDMGGKKQRKRGLFNIERYGLHVEYANLDAATAPDYLCDIAAVPVEDARFDGVILSEVLEHVPHPERVLQEAYRLLKPGGTALICTPFMLGVHADPYDFGRYTGAWYEKNLQEIGFQQIQIEKQGLFFSVLANMLKMWAGEMMLFDQKYKLRRMLFHKFVFWCVRQAFEREKDPFYQTNWMFSGVTTGFGVICQK